MSNTIIKDDKILQIDIIEPMTKTQGNIKIKRVGGCIVLETPRYDSRFGMATQEIILDEYKVNEIVKFLQEIVFINNKHS
jgi:hypothetical protein